MKNGMKHLFLSALAVVFMLGISAATEDGNVYYVDDSGGKHFICPIMGTDAVVGSDTKFADYQGKRYYFCCPGCDSKFNADPAMYVNKL